MLPETLQQHEAAAAIDRDLPGAVAGGHDRLGETTLEVDPARILEVCRYAKERLGFNRLSAITCVDWHPSQPRFEVVYHLHAIRGHRRLRLKCRVAENQPLESAIGVWRSADWYEREVFDMFGVEFRNHPNLSRILMPLDWDGHPLRKDYPIHGFKYSYKDE
ncbi:MAG: NADH-quinone oxidoreductase subunit C [Bryobacteraceae bacterium]|nr:NADH-quinone oxidoreductase subunit C [Bryobacteraceae bacterium]